MNIIIADDEYYARKALCSCIRHMFDISGFKEVSLFECSDAEHALEVLKKNIIDIVFTDIKMSQMTGIELCQIIHRDYPNTLSIIISGYADFIYAQRAIEYRVFKYLLKPIDEEDIQLIINELRVINGNSKNTYPNSFVNTTAPSTAHMTPTYANKIDSLTKKLIIYYLNNKKILLLQDLINQYIKKMIAVNEITDENAYTFYNDLIDIMKGCIDTIESPKPLLATCDYFSADSYYTLNSCIRSFQILMDDLNQQMENVNEQKQIVGKFIEYIDEHYAEDLSLHNVAETIFFLHPNYLSRLLKNCTGMSFSKYIVKVRMEKAVNMLLETDLYITTIGTLVGYNSTSYFIQTFHKLYALTPSEFRQKKRIEKG